MAAKQLNKQVTGAALIEASYQVHGKQGSAELKVVKTCQKLPHWEAET